MTLTSYKDDDDVLTIMMTVYAGDEDDRMRIWTIMTRTANDDEDENDDCGGCDREDDTVKLTMLIPPCRAKAELCPDPSGHQPAAQPGSALPGAATPPPPAVRRQPGPPLVGGRAGAHQLRRHQEVGVGATPAPRRPPQRRLQ